MNVYIYNTRPTSQRIRFRHFDCLDWLILVSTLQCQSTASLLRLLLTYTHP